MRPLILPLLAAALLPGCSTNVHYSIPEDRIEQFARRTDELVADGDAGNLTADQGRQFMEQSPFIARALAEECGRTPSRGVQLEILAKQFETLLASRKPLRSSTAAPLQATLYELRRLQGFRRHLTNEREPERIASTTSSDDSTSKDDDSKKCKNDKHDGNHKHDKDCPRDNRR